MCHVDAHTDVDVVWRAWAEPHRQVICICMQPNSHILSLFYNWFSQSFLQETVTALPSTFLRSDFFLDGFDLFFDGFRFNFNFCGCCPPVGGPAGAAGPLLPPWPPPRRRRPQKLLKTNEKRMVVEKYFRRKVLGDAVIRLYAKEISQSEPWYKRKIPWVGLHCTTQ